MGQLQFNQAADADASSELDQVSGVLKRTKLVHDMAVSLPEDMVGVITEMAMDTHEKDLMLPNMSRFLWWNRTHCSHYPAFEFPALIFRPNWLDSGLVSVQKIDRAQNQQIRQLPAVVRYVMSEYANKTRYCFVNITSTFMARSRDNPMKVYYPYQIWNIEPSYTTDPDMPVRSPEKINQDQDSERWENYWSNPLKSRVRRVRAFVRELEDVLKYENFWIFFDGRIVVTLPKNWVDCENVDTSRLGNQDCEKLLIQFQENPESLNLPPEIRSQLISKASRNRKLTQQATRTSMAIYNYIPLIIIILMSLVLIAWLVSSF